MQHTFLKVFITIVGILFLIQITRIANSVDSIDAHLGTWDVWMDSD